LEPVAGDAESLCGRAPPDWLVVALDEGVEGSAFEVLFAVELEPFCAELVLE